MRLAKQCALLFALLVPACSSGESLGVYGNTWEIGEPDLLDAMKKRAAEMDGNGETKKLQEKLIAQTKEHLQNPRRVTGVVTTVRPRTFFYDPSIVLPKDIKDQKGRVIVRAGTYINPLRMQPLSKALLFIDETDRRQVDYALKLTQSEPRTKVILVGGSWVEMSKRLQRQAYFDQGGALVGKFQIKQVPALVRQAGEVLKIEETLP